jgi:transcriptional regulator with XRE-family HTH domain
MPRKPHRQRYAVFLECLVEARGRASLTQVQVAEALDTTQTFISKCERGERRLDAVDLLDFLEVFGADPAEFMRDLKNRLGPQSRKRR